MIVNPERMKKGLYWDRAWSLVEGCTPVSEGCLNCWSAQQAHMRAKHPNPKIRARYEGLTDDQGRWTGKIRLMWDDLEKPLHVKKPTVWAIWNDLFHEDVPTDFILHALDVTVACPQHTFLILTKRPDRIAPILYGAEGFWYLGGGDYMPNVWLGVTAENQQRADERIPILLQIPAKHRFVSIEPCLSEIDLTPYLGYNTQKGETKDEQRAGTSQVGGTRGLENRQAWPNMDDEEATLEASRAQNPTRLSPSEEDGQSREIAHGSPSIGIFSLQGGDSKRTNDQSSEWHKERQQARKPGNRHLLGESEPRVQNWPEETRRTEEPRKQTDGSTDSGNKGGILSEGNNSEKLSDGIRRNIPNHIQNRSRGSSSKPTWENGRLHPSSPACRQKGLKWPIHMVIVGGESGPGARPMKIEWARSVRDQCQDAGVPFFFKQMSGKKPIPEDLMIKEFPE